MLQILMYFVYFKLYFVMYLIYFFFYKRIETSAKYHFVMVTEEESQLKMCHCYQKQTPVTR